MHNGFAIVLAWPETLCKKAGAWYDFPMDYLGISSNGYYRVGHTAVVLVDDETGHCSYFDFGRYHAPYGYGRVRSVKTDHDLFIKTKAIFTRDTLGINNLDEILSELYDNPSTHGSGTIYGNTARIHFHKALDFVIRLQTKEFIPYGPFIRYGTNCSRFVSSVVQAGQPTFRQRIGLRFPLTVSSTPIWNLRAVGGQISVYSKSDVCDDHRFINFKQKISQNDKTPENITATKESTVPPARNSEVASR